MWLVGVKTRNRDIRLFSILVGEGVGTFRGKRQQPNVTEVNGLIEPHDEVNGFAARPGCKWSTDQVRMKGAFGVTGFAAIKRKIIELGRFVAKLVKRPVDLDLGMVLGIGGCDLAVQRVFPQLIQLADQRFGGRLPGHSGSGKGDLRIVTADEATFRRDQKCRRGYFQVVGFVVAESGQKILAGAVVMDDDGSLVYAANAVGLWFFRGSEVEQVVNRDVLALVQGRGAALTHHEWRGS